MTTNLLAPTLSEFLKSKRIEQGLTLRDFCTKWKLDRQAQSRIERGMGDRAALEQPHWPAVMLKALNLSPQSDEATLFHALHRWALEASRTFDVTDKILAAKLPAVTTRIPHDKLDDVIEFTRASLSDRQ